MGNGDSDRGLLAAPTRTLAQMAESDPASDHVARLAATLAERDGPFIVVSLLLEGAAEPGGGELVFAGKVERQLLGDGMAWSRVAAIRFASRAALLAAHEHLGDGDARSIVLGCTTLPVPALPAVEPAADLFVMVHLMRFGEGGRQVMSTYAATAGAQGLALGVRPAAMFSVQSTLSADGRVWDEVRFNRFPSHSTFEQLRANQVHREGQAGRAGALADTYTFMVLPTINRLGEVAQG